MEPIRQGHKMRRPNCRSVEKISMHQKRNQSFRQVGSTCHFPVKTQLRDEHTQLAIRRVRSRASLLFGKALSALCVGARSRMRNEPARIGINEVGEKRTSKNIGWHPSHFSPLPLVPARQIITTHVLFSFHHHTAHGCMCI